MSKKAKHESTTTNPKWLQLPRDITSNILLRLGPVQILKNARNVCPEWWNICKDPSTWRQIHMLNLRPYLKFTIYGGVDHEFLVKLCKYAIDLSCGHLEEIDISDFGTDHLLQHIADRASKLRCIRVNSCTRRISDEGWCEFAKKLPMLEEIHISHSRLSEKSLQAIGQHCPLLKSLTFTAGKWHDYRSEWDVDASIIAKTMPKLSYLDIHENQLTDVGLLSILNACPLLESLNIVSCKNLEFGETLGEMLRNQIKDLKAWEYYPETCYSENEWEAVLRENVRRYEDEDEDDVFYAYFQSP